MKLPDIIAERYEGGQGFWWGRWWFFEKTSEGYDHGEFEPFALPEGFVAIATDQDDRVLAVHGDESRIVYLLERGAGTEEIVVFSESAELLEAKLKRDELWEQLSERMQASREYRIDVEFYATKDERLFSLRFTDPGDEHEREHVFTFRGEVAEGEMLVDALERLLLEVFEIEQFEVEDVVDVDRFEETADEAYVPVFGVRVKVAQDDMAELETGEAELVWVEEGN